MKVPMASAWASRAAFVVRSCSSRALAFSYRSTNPLYRAAILPSSVPSVNFPHATLCEFGHHTDLLKQALDFCINACAVCQGGLHQSAILKDVVLKDVVFAFDDSVKDGHEPCFNGFLVQMRRFAFVLTLEFAVALSYDPAVF